MSFERARLPIMSDAVMYHNFARQSPFNSKYLLQPSGAFIGLDSHKDIYKQNYLRSEIRHEIRNDNRPPLTTLITEPTGFTHTGSRIGPSFPVQATDPRYKIPTYGKTKPQVINYAMAKSNHLDN